MQASHLSDLSCICPLHRQQRSARGEAQARGAAAQLHLVPLGGLLDLVQQRAADVEQHLRFRDWTLRPTLDLEACIGPDAAWKGQSTNLQEAFRLGRWQQWLSRPSHQTHKPSHKGRRFFHSYPAEDRGKQQRDGANAAVASCCLRHHSCITFRSHQTIQQGIKHQASHGNLQ